VLALLRQETARSLALAGCATLDEVGRQHIFAASGLPGFMEERIARAA
jgi:L-lactate dehydrogenase (cytochrome)